MAEAEKRRKAKRESNSRGCSPNREVEGRLKNIERALEEFPRIVKQNAERGKAHRKLMRAFEPMARDLARRIKKQAKER